MTSRLLAIAQPLTKGEPIIDVSIAPSNDQLVARIATGRQIASPRHALAYIDTGSTFTHVSSELLSDLDIPATGFVQDTTTTLGPRPTQYHDIVLSIPTTPKSVNIPLRVASMDISMFPDDRRSYKVLLGLDVLQHGQLKLDYLEGELLFLIREDLPGVFLRQPGSN